jgi:hypothetical protein
MKSQTTDVPQLTVVKTERATTTIEKLDYHYRSLTSSAPNSHLAMGKSSRKADAAVGKKVTHKKKKVVGSRVSERVKTTSIPVAYVEKVMDGKERQRERNSLKAKTGYPGGRVFEGTKDKVMRDRVNNEKKKSRMGGAPCYDVMDDLGSSIYMYSLPLNLVRGLVMGFKTPDSVKSFQGQADTLRTHKGTNFMFLHWQGTGPSGSAGGDYRLHKYVKKRPDLQATIESLGDWISKEVLLIPELGSTKQPGVLSNVKLLPKQKIQVPHWDFDKWGFSKAENLPWILHFPLCKEGMMLHVWPTKRDRATHHLEKEKLELGDPKLVYVAFGDCLLLRADVCHGGSFGSKGNIRFHMVLRVPDCSLCPKQLHPIGAKDIDTATLEAKMALFDEILGDPAATFKKEVEKKARTVTPYVTCLEKQYPGTPSWCNDLLRTLTIKDKKK